MKYLKGHRTIVIFPLDVKVALCPFGFHAILKVSTSGQSEVHPYMKWVKGKNNHFSKRLL